MMTHTILKRRPATHSKYKLFYNNTSAKLPELSHQTSINLKSTTPSNPNHTLNTEASSNLINMQLPASQVHYTIRLKPIYFPKAPFSPTPDIKSSTESNKNPNLRTVRRPRGSGAGVGVGASSAGISERSGMKATSGDGSVAAGPERSG